MIARGVVVLCALAGGATAAPTRKVAVDSEPAGATVYLTSKENGPVCTTPCEVDAPIGDTPIILELANHVSVIENLSVSKRGGKPKVRYTLVPAVGTIKVDGPKGARITIGERDHGTAPTEIEIEAGQYVVVLTQNGAPLDSIPVDVEAGGEVTVEGAGTSEAPPASGRAIVAPASSPPRPPYVRASVVTDVGLRNFDYANVQTSATLSNEREPGVVLVGPLVELYLGHLLGVHVLRGLALAARYQYGVNQLPVTGGNIMGATTTFWQSLEVSLRHRWTIGHGGLELGGGFVRDQYSFNGDIDDVLLLPDVDYRSVRLGARGTLRLGRFEPFLAYENRIVIAGGAIERRFDAARATGLRAATGVLAMFGAVAVRLEVALTRYSWTFAYDSMATYQADSAVDSVKQVGVSVGYEM